jgi:hypothetical protein
MKTRLPSATRSARTLVITGCGRKDAVGTKRHVANGDTVAEDCKSGPGQTLFYCWGSRLKGRRLVTPLTRVLADKATEPVPA